MEMFFSCQKVLDLKSLTWSEIEAKTQSPGSATTVPVAPCAGHSLVTLSVLLHNSQKSMSITSFESCF